MYTHTKDNRIHNFIANLMINLVFLTPPTLSLSLFICLVAFLSLSLRIFFYRSFLFPQFHFIIRGEQVNKRTSHFYGSRHPIDCFFTFFLFMIFHYSISSFHSSFVVFLSSSFCVFFLNSVHHRFVCSKNMRKCFFFLLRPPFWSRLNIEINLK